MFDAFWDVWDWLAAGFCDPERRAEQQAQRRSKRNLSDDWSDDDNSTYCVSLSSYDNYNATSEKNIQDVWKNAKSSRHFQLQKFTLEQPHVDYLLSQPINSHLEEIQLYWCTFSWNDGTEQELVEWMGKHGRTLRALRFWKARQGHAIPNEMLWHILQNAIPNKMPGLQCLELSYFDLRPRRLHQALCNVLSRPQCMLRELDLSFCKLNADVCQQLVQAWQRKHSASSRRRTGFLTNNNNTIDLLETLSLNGTGMDDAMLKGLVQGLQECSLTQLRTMQLSYNHLTSASLPVFALLVTSALPSLEELQLQGNAKLLSCSTSDLGFQKFANVLSNAKQPCSLHTLNVAQCGLTSSALTSALVKAIQQGGLIQNLNISGNEQLALHRDWWMPLTKCQNLQYLTLSTSLIKQNHRQWKELIMTWKASNCALLDLKLVEPKTTTASRRRQTKEPENAPQQELLSPSMHAWLRRNQLLYLACTTAHRLPVSLWPTVLKRLEDIAPPNESRGRKRQERPAARHAATSVYGFLQSCLVLQPRHSKPRT